MSEEEVDKRLIKKVGDRHVLNVDGSMSDDDVKNGIDIEQKKLYSDIASYLKYLERLYGYFEEEEIKSEMESFKNFSNDYYVYQDIIELKGEYIEPQKLLINQDDKSNKSNLKILRECRVNGKKNMNFYITKISTKDGNMTNTHFLLLIIDNKNLTISIVDSCAGMKFAKPIREAIKTALEDHISGYDFLNNKKSLQYSSGVCETYAIKLAFFMIRMELFNNVSERLDKKRIEFLDKFVHTIINELPFGRKNANKSTINKRNIEINKFQRALEDEEEYSYSVDKTFNRKFNAAMDRDKVFLKQCVKYTLLPHVNKMAISCMDGDKIKEDELDKYMNNEENKKDFEVLGINDKKLVSAIVKKRVELKDNDKLLEYISNEVPFESIKAGFMLREAIKLKQKIEESRKSIAVPSK